ncbi:MAG: SAM-dependent methyltransferase [Lentimicrobiaceae bacterium]
MTTKKGTLFLIPTPLGEINIEQVIPIYNIQLIMELDVFIVEELRTARRFLKKCGYNKDFDSVIFYLLNEHTHDDEIISYLDQALEGKSIGLLSEAGCPAIADPGASVVKLAHEMNIRVVPLTGPSSLILSLMASGFNGQQFTFHGYLPVKSPERKSKIKELDRLTQKQSHTHIFIEAPYRNKQMIDSLLETCSENTMLCIASNITMPDESILTKSIAEWRKAKPDPGKKPTVFLLS